MALSTLRANAVGDWEACGDSFYSREPLYDPMQWEDVDLQSKRVCCSSCGGPIATMRDEQGVTLVAAGASTLPVVRIFTSSGAELGSFLWESRGRLAGWGWTPNLHLVVVEDTGRAALYTLHGRKARELSLGATVEAQGVTAVVVQSHALAVLTKQRAVWVVGGLDEGPEAPARPPVRIADPPLPDLPGLGRVQMALLEPQFSLQHSPEVLLGVGSSIWQLDEMSCVEHALAELLSSVASCAVHMMRLSPNGAFVAIFTVDGRLVVMPSDFSRQLSEFETQADSLPLEVEWCGSDGVVVLWPSLLLVVGPYGDHASWSMPDDEQVVLVPEIDSVRLLTSTKHELLRKVPLPLAEVFCPGSTSPGTKLWDARELFEANDARCDKALRQLGASLKDAVTTCIQAAGSELVPVLQKALLRAAAYGLAFCSPVYPPHAMHAMAHKLRLLNALRGADVGIPMTMAQLDALGVAAVVVRLLAQHQWLLAHRIAVSLRFASPALMAPSDLLMANAQLPLHAGSAGRAVSTLPQPSMPVASAAALEELVLLRWASAMISAFAAGTTQARSDIELKNALMAKLKPCPTFRYASLAAHAQSVGRRHLAIKLLEEESSCALQVPLLLSLATRPTRKPGGPPVQQDTEPEAGEDALVRALRKAIESGDTNLVLLVMFHIYRIRPLQEFWQLVSGRALARNLFLKYCRAKEPELLQTLLATSGETVDLADLQVSCALSTWADAHNDQTAGQSQLNSLVSSLSDASQKYATSREHSFKSRAMSSLATLKREQARIEMETGHHLLVGLSLAGTMRQLIRLNHHKHAAALKRMFAMPDRRFWWLKIRALAEGHDWDGLDAFAGERKSPIGWEPFLEVARKHGAPRDVQARLIGRMPDSATKAEQLAGIECTREAAEVAARLRDNALLGRISGMVSATSPAGLAIAQIKERVIGYGYGR